MIGYDRISADSFGDPEVLQLRHVDLLPEPGAGEARVRVEAAGVGYTDTIVRRGRYIAYTAGLPVTPGYDMVGIVDKIGSGVTDVKLGDRVADMPVSGAYSQFMIRTADTLIPVPAGVKPEAAVEVPLMWVTAWQMLTRCVQLEPGDWILVVGACGAVGRGLVALGRHLQLRVIGTCSAADVPALQGQGAIAIDYRRSDVLAAVRSATGDAGVAAAFDAIGGASWETSWHALARGGTLIGYGLQDFLESGAPASEATRVLTLFHQTWVAEGKADGTDRSTSFYDISMRRQSHPGDYRADAGHLLDLIAQGMVVPPAAEVLPLAQAAQAHRRIAAGGLAHRLVLRP